MHYKKKHINSYIRGKNHNQPPWNNKTVLVYVKMNINLQNLIAKCHAFILYVLKKHSYTWGKNHKNLLISHRWTSWDAICGVL